jgi:2-keto-4-pentenoate hydratase/2-oxohepta-3-ene-1,7-dioic acid hydratase in catechol pathway
MRIVRFRRDANKPLYGIVESDTIEVAGGDLFRGLKRTGVTVPLADVKLLAPVQPVNVFALGRNYRAHAEESGVPPPAAPVLFMQRPSGSSSPAT